MAPKRICGGGGRADDRAARIDDSVKAGRDAPALDRDGRIADLPEADVTRERVELDHARVEVVVRAADEQLGAALVELEGEDPLGVVLCSMAVKKKGSWGPSQQLVRHAVCIHAGMVQV